MSTKEYNRRNVARTVFKQMHKIRKRTHIYSLSIALKMAWQIIKGKIYVHHSKVRGVSFDRRQATLQTLASYSKKEVVLIPVRDINNSYDPNAIKIKVHVDDSKEDHEIGYFSKELAQILAPILDVGGIVAMIYEGIVGLEQHYKNLGVLFSYVVLK